MPTTEVFETLYKSLNKAQKQAVDTIEGPVMVVAGPGTGKTQILALRIAQILVKTDAAPNSILAIAFTESAVKAMRKRLLGMIGPVAHQIAIKTFHGFANDCIQEFPDVFPRIIGAEPVSDLERITHIEAILNEGTWNTLRPSGDPSYYVWPVLQIIQSLKREGYSPQRFKEYVDQQQKDYDVIPDKIHEKGAYKGEIKSVYRELQEKINKNKELVEVFHRYEERLATERQYDFEDMILEVVRAMKEQETFLRTLQERYQYVLVDEHQDTNGAQNEMIEQLVAFHQMPNLFVVGDEKQAVYRFQGASLENFRYFAQRFPGAIIIHLEQNYRSTQYILDLSHGVIAKNTSTNQSTRLLSQKTHNHNIELYEIDHEMTEAEVIADDIERIHKEGVRLEDVAVIYRNNKDASVFERVFDRRSIPYTVHSDSGVFDDIDIAQLLELCESVSHIERDDLVARVILFDFVGIKSLDAARIIQDAYRQKKPSIDVIQERYPHVYETLVTLARYAHSEPARIAFERVMYDTGFIEHLVIDPRRHEKMNKVKTVLAMLDQYTHKYPTATLLSFIEHVRVIQKHNLATGVHTHAVHRGVALMTAHKSKGLEFEHVYIVGVYDGHWGNRRTSQFFHIPGITETGHGLEDERRLFYVALTRARNRLVISYPTQNSAGKELLPSQFLEEIDPVFITRKRIVGESVPVTQRLIVDPLNSEYKAYLQALFREQGLSVTALNAYLTCPWKYFFNNLLRLPRVKTASELFGTAIHESLRKYTHDVQQGIIKPEQGVQYFKDALLKLPLSEREIQELSERGERALTLYIPERIKTVDVGTKLEHSVAIEYGHVVLRGSLDRIDSVASGAVVYDYKTGDPKTRNYILGKTKTSNGDYWRQLVFYKLLIDRSDMATTVSQGVIDFVEPDEKNHLHREVFDIQTSDVVELEGVLMRVIHEIDTTAYSTHQCTVACEYCDMAQRLIIRSN